jgi:hypothetical protein
MRSNVKCIDNQEVDVSKMDIFVEGPVDDFGGHWAKAVARLDLGWQLHRKFAAASERKFYKACSIGGTLKSLPYNRSLIMCSWIPFANRICHEGCPRK